MKLLVDTQSFLWLNGALGSLPEGIVALCQDPRNDLLVSVASLWEIQIKCQIGKMTLPRSLDEIVEEEIRLNGVVVLPIRRAHVADLDHLPLLHRDPFDRIIVAQARVENATLVSSDRQLAGYPVSVLWEGP
jgi:PIN domain nuclease of toxin-antitoxin system